MDYCSKSLGRRHRDTFLQKAGFTIIELVIIIAIMAILAAVAIAKWPGKAINLSAQAHALVSDIRYTQNLSMTKGTRYKLVKISSSSYQISNLPGTIVVTTVTLGSGISLGSFTNLPNNLLAFNGKGEPYIDATTPGTPLAVTASIDITASGHTKTISISPETGRVTL